MVARRHASILGISALTFVVLFNFQNCAPAPSGVADAGAGSDARLIEDHAKLELQFAQPDVQLRDEAAQADVSGLCSRARNGARLHWKLWQSSGAVLAEGDANCAAGGFHVLMGSVEPMVCGVPYQLVIEGDWGGSAYTNFTRRCQPLAREIMNADAAQPGGTLCEVEYVPNADNGSPCNVVCYRGDLLVSSSPTEAGRCSGIAAHLAGP